MRILKKILVLLIAMASVASIYFAINIFYFVENAIPNSIRLMSSLLLLVNFLLIWSSQGASKKIVYTSLILGATTTTLLLINLFNFSTIPLSWNVILALLVLLSGISLITRIKFTNKLILAMIGLSTLSMEVILLLKLENRLFFVCSFVLLLILTATSLLFVFRKS